MLCLGLEVHIPIFPLLDSQVEREFLSSNRLVFKTQKEIDNPESCAARDEFVWSITSVSSVSSDIASGQIGLHRLRSYKRYDARRLCAWTNSRLIRVLAAPVFQSLQKVSA